MEQLFAVMLGGRASGCNIELHDVVFVAGKNLEATYPALTKKWFGNTTRLHIDAWLALTQVDGYDIVLSHEKTLTSNNHLYFVNFGGYIKGEFNEIHQSKFYVAESKNAALQRAKQELCMNLMEQHCDDNLEIDDCLQIDTVDNFYIHLRENPVKMPLEIHAKYIKFERRENHQTATNN